ncbi:hypothetical protein VPH35_057041 [Triticum aestivum]|uniref:MSP domain-containing protein n=2 Tax=Triticum TaxID=4564 RepID=A0A9R1SAN3_TRITD|nr:unnamed protein product [Triticum aestivum]VAH86766.1 unnamed protein product [Triticum turgidum subsp. durum]
MGLDSRTVPTWFVYPMLIQIMGTEYFVTISALSNGRSFHLNEHKAYEILGNAYLTVARHLGLFLQISPYLEDDMLGIEPLKLCFPFELNSQISCSLKLTNETYDFIAFIIKTTSPLQYCIQPNKGFVAPRSKFGVNITMQPLDKAPEDNYTGDFIVRSTIVNENLEDITEDLFRREEGKLVDEVKLTIAYKAEEPQVDVPLGSPIISDTRILHGPHVSTVLSTEAESKISASTSDEVIQIDPPDLCFPLVPDKKVLSSVKIINITDLYVSIALTLVPEENSKMYSVTSSLLVMPPRSTQWLRLTRKEKEDAVKDVQFNDEVFVWYTMVAEDIKVSDLDLGDYKEYKKLPVVLTKAMPSTRNYRTCADDGESNTRLNSGFASPKPSSNPPYSA